MHHFGLWSYNAIHTYRFSDPATLPRMNSTGSDKSSISTHKAKRPGDEVVTAPPQKKQVVEMRGSVAEANSKIPMPQEGFINQFTDLLSSSNDQIMIRPFFVQAGIDNWTVQTILINVVWNAKIQRKYVYIYTNI